MGKKKLRKSAHCAFFLFDSLQLTVGQALAMQ